jgi:hypothetical protein
MSQESVIARDPHHNELEAFIKSYTGFSPGVNYEIKTGLWEKENVGLFCGQNSPTDTPLPGNSQKGIKFTRK